MPFFRTFKGVFSVQQLLLDKYPNANLALSLRKIKSNYSGACIRVRRSSDNTEQDISFNGNNLNTTALLNFVGGGDGFVSVWYDQSGKGYNFTQSTIAKQPRVVNAGTLVLQNNKPSLRFLSNSLTCSLNTGEIVSPGKETSMFFCFTTIPKNAILFGTEYGFSFSIGIYAPWSDNITYYEIDDSKSIGLRWDSLSIGSFLRNTSNTLINQNNINKLSSTNVPNYTSGSTSVAIGSFPDATEAIDGYVFEIVIYNSFLTNHQSFVTDVNGYYQVY